MSFALNVGYSIENAFGQAVDELTLMYGDDSDIVVKFKLIVIRLGQNENLEDILDDFAEESKVEDIMYFAEIFRYARRSGGDLMAVIKNTAQIIQQKEEVMSEVDTIISGKKMEQRVMSLIPAVIVIYLKVTAKEEFIHILKNGPCLLCRPLPGDEVRVVFRNRNEDAVAFFQMGFPV